MIDIAICDDQDIVREGLEAIIRTDSSCRVVLTASDGADLLDKLASQRYPKPELILLDLKMPVMNGITAAREIRKHHQEIKILVLTTYADDQWVIDALKAGANGYLLKDTPKRQLIDAIKGTVGGNTFVDPSIAGTLVSFLKDQKPAGSTDDRDLSERERQILLLIAKGLSNIDIGKQLNLSSGTVRNYTSTIFSKLVVSDRTEAAIAALRFGIISLDEI